MNLDSSDRKTFIFFQTELIVNVLLDVYPLGKDFVSITPVFTLPNLRRV